MGLVIIVLLVLVVVDGYFVVGNSNTSKRIVYWNNPNRTTYPLSSTLLLSSKLHNISNSSGIILFIGEPRATYFASKDLINKVALYQQNPDILGVIVVDQKQTPGYISWLLDIPEYQIPVWVIGKNSIPSNVLNSVGPEGMHIVLMGMEDNSWDISGGGLLFWVYSLVLVNLLCTIMSMITLVVLWRSGKRISIATICIVVEIISSIGRILEVMFEWYYKIRYAKWLETASFPFLLGASGLLVFFWLDITSGSLYSGRFLDTMKVPAIVFFIFLIINELILDLLNFYFELIAARTAIYVMYSLLTILTGALYFIVSYKISKILKSSNMTKKMQLSSINLKARICGALMWTSSFLGIIIIIPGTNETVAPFRTLWYLLYLCLCLISVVQISIFFPSKEAISTTLSSQASASKPANQPSFES